MASNNGTEASNTEEAQFTAISVGETDHRVWRSHRHRLKRRPIETRMRWTHHEPSSRGRHQRRWAHSCTINHNTSLTPALLETSNHHTHTHTHTHTRMQKEICEHLSGTNLNWTSPIWAVFREASSSSDELSRDHDVLLLLAWGAVSLIVAAAEGDFSDTNLRCWNLREGMDGRRLTWWE